MGISTDFLQLKPPGETPEFCEYAQGPCDQSFSGTRHSDALLLYPSEPEIIAHTVETAAEQLKNSAGERTWMTWRELGAAGRIIFCQICKAMRFSKLVIADVTTLNFNLLFEIGYALGLGIPVLPIRDTSYARDERTFEQLGLLDTIGYLDFQNSTELLNSVLSRADAVPPFGQIPQINKEQPLFVVKSHLQNEGMVRLMSALKKSGLRFRTFDPRESSRLSLHEAHKQVHSSLGVLVHLVGEGRTGARVHNSRCALVAGLAMAAGKNVLMLQEQEVRSRATQPIDYRDVVRHYSNPKKIPDILIPLVKSVVGKLQETRFVPTTLPLTPLEKVDLGDLAAENEIRALGSYFVPTGQYNQAKRGHARLVVGRKGAGKTAIFYGIRSAYWPSRAHLVLDLKPEGHQLVKLREAVLRELSGGFQQHVLTAFWNYLLAMELAQRIIHNDGKTAYRDMRLKEAYDRVVGAYDSHKGQAAEHGDFSERLLALVDDIVDRKGVVERIQGTGEITRLVYRDDIRPLNDSLAAYLAATRREDVWLLFDNIDKGWPILEAQQEDILLIKSLLEASRKLQRQFINRGIDLHAVVFVRNDIYDHLLLDPAERGKETAVILDWDDPEVFKEILRRRIILSTGLEGKFEELWNFFFATHVGGEDSFSYVLRRTLMRPREFLRFVRDCINVAANRGHELVSEEDILHAEVSYSHDAFVDLTLELKDVKPEFSNTPYAFIGVQTVFPTIEADRLIAQAGVKGQDVARVVQLLLWFGFLGIHIYPDEERYSYQYQHNVRRMQSGLNQFAFCIHPAFRRALGCVEQ